MTAPEPLMPLLIARKPGGKPLEVLIDEAAGEQVLRDVAVALAGIRAARRAMAVMLTPSPRDEVPPGEGTATVTLDNPDGRFAPPGDVVDATIHEEWCDGGHGDAAPCPPDASAGAGELPPPWSDEGNAAFWAAHPRVAAALASVPGAGLDDPAASPPPCPDGPADEHGPCARLAGHPVPHRDIHGSEWFPGGGTRAPEPSQPSDWSRWPDGLEDAAAEEYDDDSFPSCAHHGCKHLESRHDDGHGGCTFPGCTCEAYDPHGEPDEPMPVSFLPLNRAALIGGGA